MNGATTHRSFVVGGMVAFALLALLPLFLSDWIVFLLALALAKGAVVLGVVLLLRGGLISFGHALYFAVGAYTVAFCPTDSVSARPWSRFPWRSSYPGCSRPHSDCCSRAFAEFTSRC